MIADGSISPEKFEERKKEFDKAFSKGAQTPLGKIVDGRDSYYHIIGRHDDQLFNDDGVQRIVDTLKNPAAVYETTDRRGTKGEMYVQNSSDDSLIVVTRNGRIVTAYEPDPRYLNKQKRREASILMEFENVDFKATTYFMDETVPAIGVDFLDVSGKTFFGEIELPGDGVSMIYTDSTKEGEISYIEIVDPSDFLSDPAFRQY